MESCFSPILSSSPSYLTRPSSLPSKPSESSLYPSPFLCLFTLTAVGALGFLPLPNSSPAVGAPSCDELQSAAFASLGNIDIYDAYSNGACGGRGDGCGVIVAEEGGRDWCVLGRGMRKWCSSVGGGS